MTVSLGVVVAVHDGVSTQHLKECLTSLTEQTRPPDVVWVVMDGPVSTAHEQSVAGFAALLPLTLMRLSVNRGAGPARQLALESSSTDFFAVADSDDVSLPERFSMQLDRMLDQKLDLMGSAMQEFGTALIGERLRATPTGIEEIRKRLRINNPFNHPTVMMRTEAAKKVGGYRDMPYLEDYDLIARMIAGGAAASNMAEPLVRFRMDVSTVQRRASRRAAASEWRLQQTLYRLGFVSKQRAWFNFVVRNGYRVAPQSVRNMAYERFLVGS